ASQVIDETAPALTKIQMLLPHLMLVPQRVSLLIKATLDVPAADDRAVARVLVKRGQLAGEVPVGGTLDIYRLLADRAGVIA
ncbi:hypothetical protein, partial [Stenotrophomonas sp. SrG]|uniref:hypothetical protein n=1 Tax=Stenotrophomonas sp. SrG TaxID=3414430 RepID=UPI003CF244B2